MSKYLDIYYYERLLRISDINKPVYYIDCIYRE